MFAESSAVLSENHTHGVLETYRVVPGTMGCTACKGVLLLLLSVVALLGVADALRPARLPSHRLMIRPKQVKASSVRAGTCLEEYLGAI